MHRLNRYARILLLAFLLLATAQSISFAQGTDDGKYLALDAGRFDLVRAHNQRMLVLFGNSITFKRYEIVDILNQDVTVASDVHGGVRYEVHETPGAKTLVID